MPRFMDDHVIPETFILIDQIGCDGEGIREGSRPPTSSPICTPSPLAPTRPQGITDAKSATTPRLRRLPLDPLVDFLT